MFCGLGEEERTKIRKKIKRKKKEKKKKKKKNLIAAKSGLIGMKGYLKTYNQIKYFLQYLLTELESSRTHFEILSLGLEG